jgi:hypothetical protein
MFKHVEINLCVVPQSFFMYHDIEAGAEFFLDETDYISTNEAGKKSRVVKAEVTSTSVSTSSRSRPKSDASSPLTSRGRKRPRRAATTIRSYAVPDSDDDMVDDDSAEFTAQEHDKKPKTEESSLQKWVKHLGNLVKEEQRKVHLLSFSPCSCCLIPHYAVPEAQEAR